MIHKLTPSDNHNGTGVIVETLVRMHRSRYDPGQRQLVTGDANSRRAHTIGEERSDQPGKRKSALLSPGNEKKR